MSDVNYFAGAPNAFAGGMEFAAAQRRRRQSENALNALIQQYGPQAADPAAAAALQGIRQDAQMFPHQLGMAERTTAAQEALVEQQGPLAGDPSAVVTDAAMSSRLRSSMLNAARYLQATQQRNGDTSEAFGRVVPILAGIGMPTEQITALKEQILTDPSSLDELVTMLSGGEGGARAIGAPIPVYDEQGRPRLMQYLADGTTRLIDGVAPVSAVQGEQRLQQGNVRLGIQGRQLSLDEAKARGFNAPEGYEMWEVENPDGTTRYVMDAIPGGAAETEAAAGQQERATALQQDEVGLESALGDAGRVERWGQRALGLMDESWISNPDLLSATARRAASVTPGTATYEIQRDLENIRGVIAIDELLRIKARGGTLGQVTERELELLKNKLSTLDVRRDPRLLREDVAEVLEMYRGIVQRAQGDIQRIRARRAEPAPGRYGPAVPARPGAEAPPSLDDLLNWYAPRP